MFFLSRFVQSVSAESELTIQEKLTENKQFHKNDWLNNPSGLTHSKSLSFYLFRGILTFSLIVAVHDALNASTNANGPADYFHWLLKKETGNQNPISKPSPETNAFQTLATPIQTASIQPPQPKSRLRVVIERIHRNDTYDNLMERQNISKKVAAAFANQAKPIFNLHQSLKIDTPVKLTFNQDNQLIGFDFPINHKKILRIIVNYNQQILASLEDSRPLTPLEKISIDETKSSIKDQVDQTKPSIEGNQLDSEMQVTSDDDEIFAEDDNDTEQLSSANTQPKETTNDNTITKEITIRPGDTLASLLARRHITNATSLQISKAAKPIFDLARQLSPGKTITLSITAKGTLTSLVYPIDHERTFWMTKQDNQKFIAKIEKNPLEVRLESIDGTIHNERSLFVAAKHGGLSQSQAIKLSGLFEWDIDFAHDLHAGDHFTIVQEGLFFKGKRVRDGDIVAAEFTNRGKVFRAVRYIDPKGNVDYYDKDGNNVRKMFIRAPMDFTRISSLFSNDRLHPVFGYNRAHKGVDYAAPKGTPVRASGDGVIDFIGYSSGFGKLITVRHNNKYTTAYAHLNSFSSNLQKGSRIKQGEVIGQVGATGTATGPHLHYEVRINDQQVNPLSIQLPSNGPVSKKYLTDFRNQSNQLMALLKKRKSGDVTYLASLLLPNVRTQAR